MFFVVLICRIFNLVLFLALYVFFNVVLSLNFSELAQSQDLLSDPQDGSCRGGPKGPDLPGNNSIKSSFPVVTLRRNSVVFLPDLVKLRFQVMSFF